MLGLLQQSCGALFDITDPKCNNRTLEATYEQLTLEVAHEASKHGPTDLPCSALLQWNVESQFKHLCHGNSYVFVLAGITSHGFPEGKPYTCELARLTRVAEKRDAAEAGDGVLKDCPLRFSLAPLCGSLPRRKECKNEIPEIATREDWSDVGNVAPGRVRHYTSYLRV